MTQYRLKPVIVDAFHYTGQYSSACPEWARIYVHVNMQSLGKDIWLIKGLDGTIHHFRSEAFNALYEPVEGTEEKFITITNTAA